jgi:flagellar biosynthetic protein FliQ
MTQGQVLDIARESLYMIIICSAPLLLISLVVGLIVSIFQTVTSIQEQTLTFVPKIICVFLGLMLFGSWILTNLTEYVNTLWADFSIYLKIG